MKRVAIATLLALLPASAIGAPATYTVNKDHTDVVFEIDHVGFSMKHGWFRDIAGTLTLDEARPEASKVDITIKAASIDTNHEQRDKDLTGAQFLDVAKFPEMRFVSTKVTKTGANTADIEGSLTLHGVTKPLILHAKLNKLGPNPFDQTPTAGFTATGSLKRSDFGISTFVGPIGDEVAITIDAEFAGKK